MKKVIKKRMYTSRTSGWLSLSEQPSGGWLLCALVSERLLAACFFTITASCSIRQHTAVDNILPCLGASPLVWELIPCAVPPPSFRWLRVQCQCSGLPLW